MFYKKVLGTEFAGDGISRMGEAPTGYDKANELLE